MPGDPSSSGGSSERGRGRDGSWGSDRGRGGFRGARGRGEQFSVASRGGRSQEHASYAPRGQGRGRGGDRGRGRGGYSEVQVFTQGNQVAQPDLGVTRIENNITRPLATVKAQVSSLDRRFPQRPGFGTQGRGLVLWTNHLQLVFNPDLLLYRYSIEILAGAGGRPPAGKKAKRVIQLLLMENFALQEHGIATDFRSNLISKNELDIKRGEYEVHYKAEDEDEPSLNAKRYRVRLQYTGALTVSELTSDLTSTSFGGLFGSKEEILQALNIVLGHHAKAASQIASIGTNRHYIMNSPDKVGLGAGLQAIRGFFCSVRAATSRILLNVQVKHGAFYEDCPLDILAKQFLTANKQSLHKLANFLKKVSVSVTHIVRKNRQGTVIKRIKVVGGLAIPGDGHGQDLPPPKVAHFGAGPKEVEFFIADRASQPASQVGGRKKSKVPAAAGPSQGVGGRYISVYNHFETTYGIVIRDTTLPVVNVGSQKNPSYLPLQVCHVLPGQPARSQLTPVQLQQTIRFAVRKPAQNAQSIITSGVHTLGILPLCPTLESFGIEASPKLLAVPGRVLSAPVVKYRGGKETKSWSGGWNMRSVQLATTFGLSRWTYLMLSVPTKTDPWGSLGELNSSLNKFKATLQGLGIEAAPHLQGLRIVLSPDDAESQIDDAIRRFAAKNPPQLLLVILPSTDNTVLYNRVKYACDIMAGILNVCVDGSKFAKANEQYYANVAMKVNLKLNGQNHYLDDSELGIISEGKTMVVGIDVTHPSPGSAPNAPSVAAIVASVDGRLAQWPADLRIQAAQQEMVADLDTLLKSRLQLWKQHNGSFPENILVCRDGVSEGEYKRVLEQEEPQLRKACRELYPLVDTSRGLPRLTFVIVGKRHNARFYPAAPGDADRSGNPPNGTVVDRGITEAGMWDYYLQAHTALQGTARPAHYTVVLDEIFRSRQVVPPFQNAAEVVEDLFHNLCYLFGRATKAVSICPPAYYADLVCGRARCYLSGVFRPPISTGAGPSSTEEAPPERASLEAVKIHANVRDCMFYI